MKRNFILFLCFGLTLSLGCLADGKIVMSNSSFAIRKVSGKENLKVNWLVIHHNEYEADQAMRWSLERIGGTGYSFINKRRPRQRAFRDGRGKLSYLFDPNRIFSKIGILKNLRHYNGIFLYSRRYARYERKVIAHIDKNYTQKITNILPLDKEKYLIALHNNMNKSRFSLLFYKKKKGYIYYHNPSQNVKNFALVIRYEDFVKLKKANINVVWQKSTDSVNNDGSLAYYCQQKGYKYINIESRFGDAKEHKAIINAIYQTIIEPVSQDKLEKLQ